LYSLEGHKDFVTRIAINPVNDDMIASGGGDD
jgi:ribosome assembly protein SQT1